MARSMPARGNAPGTCPGPCFALQGRRIPAPLQGAPLDSETQGVALGWSAAALSAPESKSCKSEFTSLDSWPIVRSLRVCFNKLLANRTVDRHQLRAVRKSSFHLNLVHHFWHAFHDIFPLQNR